MICYLASESGEPLWLYSLDDTIPPGCRLIRKERSLGHLDVIGASEYYHSGDIVFVAPIVNGLDDDGYRLGAGYVCQINDWSHRHGLIRGIQDCFAAA